MFSPPVISAALSPPELSPSLSLTWLGASEAVFSLSYNVLLALASIAGCCSALWLEHPHPAMQPLQGSAPPAYR